MMTRRRMDPATDPPIAAPLELEEVFSQADPFSLYPLAHVVQVEEFVQTEHPVEQLPHVSALLAVAPVIL